MTTEKPTEQIKFTAKDETELAISISAEQCKTAEILLAAEAWAIKNSLTQQCRLDIQLCLDELFSNICRYAEIPKHSKSDELPVTIVLKRENNNIVIVLSDNGKKFNPIEIPPPNLTVSVEERSIGGLGLFLVRSTAKKARYAYKEGRNIIELLLDAAG
jgi:anti-sigma regulatory factor (Ser/Thr protein kinase)